MRDLESRLRHDTTNLEEQIPFWEFLDIEFDAEGKEFHLSAHYTQTPTFPELFKNLIGSPAVKRVEDEVTHPGEFINKIGDIAQCMKRSLALTM